MTWYWLSSFCRSQKVHAWDVKFCNNASSCWVWIMSLMDPDSSSPGAARNVGVGWLIRFEASEWILSVVGFSVSLVLSRRASSLWICCHAERQISLSFPAGLGLSSIFTWRNAIRRLESTMIWLQIFILSQFYIFIPKTSWLLQYPRS